ncbi:MAG: hypothetical protein IK062_01105 [Selenomonadaceae bacterium]|nr:hypothetical protein [Selenomonadaceae bacterium]
MDDYTWRKRMEARRRRRKFERAFVIFLLILGLSGIVWYITSYTKTPSYSMNEMFEAFQENDVENFRSHLELPTITAKAYDDLTVDLFKYDTQLSDRERSLFENFYVLIRTQMCQGAIKVINKKLDSGQWTLPEEMLKGRQLGIDFDLLLERSLIRHTSILGVENVIHNGNTATADIKVVEDYSQIPFTLKVTLQNFSSASWQVGQKIFELGGKSFVFPGMSFTFGKSDWRIISVDNYREYLDAVSPTLKKDLADYIDATSEIVNRYNESFLQEQNAFITMQRTPYGIMTDSQRAGIANYINQVIIPMRQYRQNELDAVPIPKGATYLSNLRKESTAVTISAWQSYARGLLENNSAAFDTAESLHKQELALDQRIEELVHNSAVTRNLPDLP